MKHSPRQRCATADFRGFGLNLFSLVLALMLAPGVHGASISWSAATTIAGDTDVSTVGTFVYGYSFANSTQTVNGVTFTGTNSTGSVGGGNLTLTGITGANNATAFNSASNPFAALSLAYRGMLIGASYTAAGTTVTVTLNNLTVGRVYRVQFWANDPRPISGRNEVLSSVGGNSVTLTYSIANVAGSPGQYSNGVFIADATTQAFTLLGNQSTQINAIQLRDITNFGYWNGTASSNWNNTPDTNFCTNLPVAPLTSDTFTAVKALAGTVVFADAYFDNNSQVAVNANNIAIAAAGVSTGVVNFSNNTVNYTFTGADAIGIASTTVLSKAGTGTVTFTTANTYTGATAVRGGTLVLQSSNTSPTYTIGTGATLEWAVASGTRDSSTANFSGTGTLKKSGAGILQWGTTAATFALGAGSLIDVQGGTFIGGSSANEVWTNNLSSLNVAAGAIFDGVEANVNVDALTGAGTIKTGYPIASYQNLSFGKNNGSGTFSGSLQNSQTTGNFVKAGTGTQTLTGANTYAGTTAINAGALIVNGSNAGTGAYTVASGATLGGNGTIAGAVTVNTGGVLSPGDPAVSSGIGQLTLTGSALNLAALVNVNFQLGNTPATTFTGNSDFIDASAAAVDLGGATLNLTGAPTAGRYRLIKIVGGSVSGTLQLGTVPPGVTVTVDTTTNAPNVDLVVSTATTYTWTGSGASPNWSLATNWTSSPTAGLAPTSNTSNATLVFPAGALQQATSNNDITASTVFFSMSFTGGAYTLSGNSFGVSTSVSATGGTHSINTNLVQAASANLNTTSSASLTVGVAGTNTLALATGTTLTLNAAAASPLIVNSAISGTNVSVTNLGAGTATLGGANTFTGATTVSSGTLQIGDGTSGNLAAGTTVVVFSGAILALNMGNNATLNTNTLVNNGTVRGIQAAGTANTVAVSISGSGSVGQTGAGTTILSGTNSYTGGTSISAGSIMAGSSTALAGGALALSGTGTFDLNGNSISVTTLTDAATTFITESSAVPGLSVLSIKVNMTNNLASLISDSPTRSLQISVVNNNTSTQILANTGNTFSGGLVLAHSTNGTRLTIPAASGVIGTAGNITSGPFGKGPIIVGNGPTDRAGIYVPNAGSQIVNPIIVNTVLGSDRPCLRFDGTGCTVSGNITANLSNAVFSTNGTGSVTVTGQILSGASATGLATENTFGTSITVTLNNLTGTPNSYSGDTNFTSKGTLALAASDQIPNGAGKGNMVMNGTFNLNGYNDTINGLSGAGIIDGNFGSPALSVGDNDQSGSFSGILRGTLTLYKIGTGVLTLAGTSTHSGPTTVTTGTLAGTGTLSNSTLFINANGIIAPGTASVGTFTAAEADFSGGGTLLIRAQSPALVDKLVLTRIGNTANLAPFGGTAKIDLSGFSGAAEPIIVQSNTWTTGTGFTPMIVNKPAGVTNVKISYKNVDATTKQVLLSIDSAVTPVKIDAFAAKAQGAGVAIGWTAVSEYQNAGFNIYRRAAGSDAVWTRVNPALIAGRVTNADEKKYSFYDWAVSGVYEYTLESVSLANDREFYAAVTSPVTVDWNSPLASTESSPAQTMDAATNSLAFAASVTNAQQFSERFAALHPNSQQAGARNVMPLQAAAVREFKAGSRDQQSLFTVASGRELAPPGVQESAARSLTVGARWFSSRPGTSTSSSAAKVVYGASGVMLIKPGDLPAGFNINRITLQREGRAFSALATTPAGLLVYAPGYQDDYTDKDALFLRTTSGPTLAGRAMAATGLFASAMPVNLAAAAASVTQEYRDVYFDYNSGFRPFVFAPWFSEKYLTGGTAQEFTLKITQMASGPAALTVNLWSLTKSGSVNPDHALQVAINGQAVGEAQWNGGGKMLQLTFNVPPGVLNAGPNTVSLITPALSGADSQIAFLHSLTASYTRAMDASAPFEIVNAGGAAQVFELSNIPPEGVWVVDARYPDRAALAPVELHHQLDGTSRLRFVASGGGTGKYLVTPAGQENRPLSVTKRKVAAVRLQGTYLATGPAQFAPGVQPLLARRAKDGIRGAYVDQEQIFDYYNFGRFGPDGIRNAVRSVRPQYLLLVGKTTYDYHNYSGLNVDPLCPAFLVSTSFWAQTTSDSTFGDLGRGYPEVAVGRLPVGEPGELTNTVRRIINYSGIPVSGMRLHAVADKPDPLVANFGDQLDTLKANNPEFAWQENYLERTFAASPEITAAMKAAANGGADIILYAGHGNASHLGSVVPQILDQTSVQGWAGNVVFVQATCTAHWDAANVPGYKSIAMQAMTQPQGGISAGIGTSTYMNPDAAVAFTNQLLRNTQSAGVSWGTALMKAQQWAAQQNGGAPGWMLDLSKTEQLFGDPAMRVFMNGRPATDHSGAAGASGTAATATGTF